MLNPASENCYIAGAKALPGQAEIIRKANRGCYSVGWRVKQEAERDKERTETERATSGLNQFPRLCPSGTEVLPLIGSCEMHHVLSIPHCVI